MWRHKLRTALPNLFRTEQSMPCAGFFFPLDLHLKKIRRKNFFLFCQDVWHTWKKESLSWLLCIEMEKWELLIKHSFVSQGRMKSQYMKKQEGTPGVISLYFLLSKSTTVLALVLINPLSPDKLWSCSPGSNRAPLKLQLDVGVIVGTDSTVTVLAILALSSSQLH